MKANWKKKKKTEIKGGEEDAQMVGCVERKLVQQHSGGGRGQGRGESGGRKVRKEACHSAVIPFTS